MSFNFTIEAQEDNARTGHLETPHGPVQTPAFMPVGTQATVKGITPQQLRQTGAQMVLSNTYHLMLRPGVEVVENAGGLAAFMGWNGPTLSDSGGYQVFSLARGPQNDRNKPENASTRSLVKIDDEGVTFNSHIDGARIRLTPAQAISIQNRLGADIIMAFDECTAYPVGLDEAQASAERTIRWAQQCRQAHGRTDQALFAIVQGSVFEQLRRHCAESLVRMDFPGYAVGGLSVGESHEYMRAVLEMVCPILPADKPRYLMGVGMPRDIVMAVATGIDMFDCVLPTRNARNGLAFTDDGPVRLKNLAHKTDTAPLDQQCSCYTCRNFSRSYLRHLAIAGEMLSGVLLSIHNLSFYHGLMARIRRSIAEGNFRQFAGKIRSKH
ncbi:MAG: tRNA guanosine(34) transglycosylase Tgt [Actinobacteria bacterium]|nr:tRNA guanosine(34) transglycosylase Tgt [Actinomycetota bacterium]